MTSTTDRCTLRVPVTFCCSWQPSVLFRQPTPRASATQSRSVFS